MPIRVRKKGNKREWVVFRRRGKAKVVAVAKATCDSADADERRSEWARFVDAYYPAGKDEGS